MNKSKLITKLFASGVLWFFMACNYPGQSNLHKTILLDSAELSLAKEKAKILTFLSEIRAKHVLGGIHNREPNSNPTQWTNKVYDVVGDYPALWSGDFLFQKENIDHRQTMITEAIRQFKKGAIINLMWHACNPANAQPCDWDNGKGVLSNLTDAQWEELFTDGSAINKQFTTMMDQVALHLQRLKDSGVVALFRPFHEMNQGKFWWGGRPGKNGTLKLFQMIHNYMVKEKQLNNLIWVWNIQDFPTLDKDVDKYNPGEAYWDIVSLDVYDDVTGYSKEKYETIQRVANGKPMGIGECQRLPSLQVLEVQRDWVFFMGWSELVFEHNSKERIKEIYNSERVFMLSEITN